MRNMQDKALEKRYGGVCIIMPCWDSTCAMCMTRRWRKNMGVSVLSCQVEIIHVQYARQGFGEKIWGVSVLWRPTWPRLVPRLLDWLSCQWPVLSHTYKCWTIDNAEVAFLSILIICLSEYYICDPRYILYDVTFCTFQRNNIFDQLDFCELRHLTRQRGGVMQSSKSCLAISWAHTWAWRDIVKYQN